MQFLVVAGVNYKKEKSQCKNKQKICCTKRLKRFLQSVVVFSSDSGESVDYYCLNFKGRVAGNYFTVECGYTDENLRSHKKFVILKQSK